MPRFAPFRPLGARPPLLAGVGLLFFALAVSGCAKTAAIAPNDGARSNAGTTSQALPAQYADIPIPRGATRNIDKTVVVGTRTWFGQLSLDTSHNAESMFNFYSRELPNYGWRKITSVRAPISVLSYDREDRVLTIAIQPNRLRGSEVTVTVSPREEPLPATAEPPPPAVPPGGARFMPAPVPPTK